MDEGESQLVKLTRLCRERCPNPRQLKRARIGPMKAGKDLDQRRLPRTVLADEPVNLASIKSEIYGAEGNLLIKTFGKTSDSENNVLAARDATRF